MIPIWAKDRKGVYKVFPQHVLETFADGKRGVDHNKYGVVHWLTFIEPWLHLFEYHGLGIWLLKKQPKTE